jgi:regulatory protein
VVGQGKARASEAAERDYLTLALRSLARSDKTVAQLERLLRAKGADEPHCRSVIRELERRGYLNDQAFAARWAEAKLLRRPMGRARLKAELLQRGFNEAVAEKAVRLAYHGRSEQELACAALGANVNGRPSVQRARFLRQRGFDDDTIQHVTQINLETGSDES